MRAFSDNFIKKISISFLSLGSVQLINLLFPLLITPHLISNIGIENFGIISFAQALGVFSTNIVDFGFNYTATRAISVHRLNSSKVSSIVTHTIASKMLLFFTWFVVLFLFVFFFRIQNIKIILLFQLVVFSQIFIPNFLFQGLENTKIVALTNFPVKFINIVLIYMYLDSNDEMYLYPIIQTFSNIVGSLLLLHFYFKYNFFFTKVRKSKVISSMKKSFSAFISSFSINIYSNTNIIFLQLFVTDSELGYYSVAEKVYFLIKQPLNVFIAIIYPICCKIATESKEKLKIFLSSCVKYSFLFYLVFLIGVFIFVPQISFFFIKTENENQKLLLRFIVFLPLFILLLNFKPYLFFLSTENEKVNNKIIIISALGSIGFCIILSYLFHAFGAIFSLIISEIAVGVWLLFEFKKSIYYEEN